MRNKHYRGIPRIVTLLIICWTAMTITASAQIFSVAPFVQTESAGSEIVTKTEIGGREIICGSKKLLVQPGGEVVLMSDGRALCHIFMGIAIGMEGAGNKYMNQKQGSSVEIPCQAGAGTFGIDASSYDKDKKEYFVSGNFPLIKGQSAAQPESDGRFTEKIKLLEDGKIGVNFEIAIPEEQVEKFKGGWIFFNLNKSLYENEKIVANAGTDKEKEIQVLQKNQVADLPGIFEYVPGDDVKGFKVKVEGEGQFCIHESCPVGDTRFNLNHRLLKKNGGRLSLRLTLDMGTGRMVKNENSDNVCAGIDFKGIDDLELPYNRLGKNLLKNPSFEQGVMYCLTHTTGANKFEGTDDVTADSTQFLFGKHSLKYKLGNGPVNNIVNVSPTPVTAGTYTFSLYAKGSASSNQTIGIMLRSNVVWVENYANKTFALNNEWQRYSITFKLTAPAILALYLVPRHSDNTIGDIWIDGMQLEKGDAATEFSSPPVEGALLTANEENFFNINDPINASLRIYSSAPGQRGKVKVTVKNFFSETVFEKSFPFSTAKDGLCAIPLDFNGKFPQGIYIVKAEYALADVSVCRDFFRFSIMSYVMKQTGLKTLFADAYQPFKARDVYPGLETYLGRSRKLGVFGDTSAGNISENMFHLYQKYGMEAVDTTMPLAFNRGSIFTTYKFVDSSGKELLGDFRLEAGGKLTEDYLKRFENVIAETVRKSQWIPRWELSAESDAGMPELAIKDPESWARLQIAFYRAVKSVNPNLKVGNDQPANIEPAGGISFIKNGLSQLNGRIKFDFLGAHPYITDGPYALDASVEELSDMAAKYGYTADTPLLFNEGLSFGVYNIPQFTVRITPSWSSPNWHQGALSYDMGWTEKLSAAWFARSYLVLMKHNGRVISQSSGASEYRNNYDLDCRLTPRAYQKIPNTLNNILGNAKFIRDVSFAPKTRCLIFEDVLNNCPIAAVWSEYGNVDYGSKESPWAIAEFGKQPVEIYDLMDVKRTFAGESEGQVKFPVSPFPFFIKGAAGSSDSFCATMADARLQGVNELPLKLVGKVVAPDRMELIVANEIARTVNGVLTGGTIREEISLKPFEKSKISIALPEKLEADKIKKNVMPISLLEKGGKAVSKEFSFDGFVCRKTTMPKTIDGNIEDWADIPAIQLKNRHIGKPAEVSGVKENDFDGYFKTAWDNDSLYLLVVIKDRMFVHDEYAKTESRW
ncbi:MAG: carbohydrate binding domain-containing protein, partial [Victivallales bacterium]